MLSEKKNLKKSHTVCPSGQHFLNDKNYRDGEEVGGEEISGH